MSYANKLSSFELSFLLRATTAHALPGDDRSRRRGLLPRQMVAGDAGEAPRQDRESGALPPSPCNGNQPGRGSATPAPAPPRQIPAAPSPPAVRHEAGPMAEAIAPWAI